MTKKITEHGKIRIKERVNSNIRVSSLRHQVLSNGKSLYDYTGKFFQYLKSKENGRFKIKVYKNYLYVFSKNSRRIITTYQVSDKYIPLSDYEILPEISKIINIIISNNNKYINVFLNDGNNYYGVVDFNPNLPRDQVYLTLDDELQIKIYGNEIIKIVSCYDEVLYEKDKIMV